MPVEPQPSSRRLSAIMFTDIVGYSALTQHDEALALRLLDVHNSTLRTSFSAFRGMEIKTVGDAFLTEFTSALEAVECAIAIQRALFDRNKNVPPAERFDIRIGIHVGDVVHVKGDVLGDGVNIASRIHTAAEPGGICVSEDVARQVRNKLQVPLREIGPRTLKNISATVRLYDVNVPWQTRSWGRRIARRLGRSKVRVALAGAVMLAALLLSTWNPLASPLSQNRIAVLPLRNLSEDRQDEYFAEGISEELISSLSKISGLEVIASSSVMRYREASLSFSAIGGQLRAGSLLEGSVRRWADTARVTVRLIDAASERLLWSEDYNRPFHDLLNVQNEIAMRVASALRVQLLDAEKTDLNLDATSNHEAWRDYLLGKHHLAKRTSDDIEKSLDYFNRSIAADPRFAPTYAAIAEAYTLMAAAGYGNTPRAVAVQEAERAVQRALELNPRLAEAHAVYAYIQFRLQWKWYAADSLFRNAIALKPSYAKAHEWYGLYLALIRKFDRSIAEMSRAYDLDPHSASVGTGLGRVYSFSGQDERSVAQLHSVLEDHPDYAEAHFALGLALLYGGQAEKGIASLETAVRLSNRRPVILADLGYAYALTGRTEKAVEIRVELDSLSATSAAVTPWVRSIVYIGLGETETALDLLEESYRLHDGLLVYLNVERMANVEGNVRFQEILKGIGFPEE